MKFDWGQFDSLTTYILFIWTFGWDIPAIKGIHYFIYWRNRDGSLKNGLISAALWFNKFVIAMFSAASLVLAFVGSMKLIMVKSVSKRLIVHPSNAFRSFVNWTIRKSENCMLTTLLIDWFKAFNLITHAWSRWISFSASPTCVPVQLPSQPDK